MTKLFSQMRSAKGGLVLFGVSSEGDFLGITPAEIDTIYDRFGDLCRELTSVQVKMGTLVAKQRFVVFLIFNTIPMNTAPLASYPGRIERVRFC